MNNKMILMLTRLKIPEPRRDYIIREKLFSKLDKINEYKVTLVKGGAGAGKTTLITSFVKERGIKNLRWISFDESCNNIFIFWSYFIEAIGEYLGESREEFVSIHDSNIKKDNIEKLITLLINKLEWEKDIYITFDDFYYITDDFLLSTIEFFLNNSPSNIHIIIITRYEPNLYLAALSMEGSLLIIDEEDLKFSLNDGVKFLNNTLKLSLDEDTANYISEVSEGWIGGMQLIATAKVGNIKKEISKLNLNNKLLGEYLTKEIYEFLDEEEKRFLVFTSMLSYFNEEICNRLLDDIRYNKILNKFMEKNILIICIDEESGIYRYHNILKEYLIGRFNELSRKIKLEYHKKVAYILKDIGDYKEAIHQLILGRNYEEAMKLILEQPENITLFSYVDRMPISSIIENPDFSYQSFFYHYVNMEFNKCRELYSRLEENISEDLRYSAFRLSNLLIEDNLKIDDSSIMSISEIHRLPLKDITKAFILIKDASFLCINCKYKETLEYIEEAISYSKSFSNSYIDFFAFSIKSYIFEEMGEFNKCIEFYEEMEKIKGKDEKSFMLSISFYIGITGVYLKQMDIKSAKKSLESVNRNFSEASLSLDRAYKYNLAEYKFIIGEYEEAMVLLRELMNMESYKNTLYISLILNYVFKKNKLSGEYIEEFINSYETIEEKYKTLESKLLYVNILYSKGKVEEGIKLVDEILSYSRRNKIKIKIVQASLCKIKIIYDNKGNKREVINLFREAIFYSYENKILQPYYLQDETVVKVIKEYNNELYSSLNVREKLHYKEVLKICKIGSQTILSEREMDVLNEIAKGASNKEIAETLCISLATVKSHIINIYGKLQVNNRVSAIEAAKNLGIW